MKTLLNAFDRLMIAVTFAEAGLESPLAANTTPPRRDKHPVPTMGGAMPAAGIRH